MLPAENRLRRRQDFETTVRRGRRTGRRHLVVHFYVKPDRASDLSGTVDPHVARAEIPPRAGFVVGRAVGTAVVRNRVKRRLRHLLRQHLHRLPAGSLIVVRALPPAAAADSAHLGSDLDAALGRLLVDAARGNPRLGAGS